MPTIFLLISILLATASLPALSEGAPQGTTQSEGVTIRVDRFTVEPLTVSPGQRLILSGEYSVMAPDRRARLLVMESVITSFYDEQKQQWREGWRNFTTKTVSPGKHRFSIPISPPPSDGLSDGRFLLTFQVIHDEASDQQSQEVRFNPSSSPPPDQGAPPVIVLRAPAPDQQVTTAQIQVIGTAAGVQRIVRLEVQVNGEIVAQRALAGQNEVEFSEQVLLHEGLNEIVVTALDQRNRSTHQRVTVTRMEARPFGPDTAEAPEGSRERRIALVIGNSTYSHAPLSNPVNDARDMSAALQELGFKVTSGENLTLQAMEESIQAFGEQLQRGNVGLFYFAGHGYQVDGINYLIPIRPRIEEVREIKSKAVSIDTVLAKMEAAQNKMNIVILDACRSYPIRSRIRSASQGLASIDNAPSGTLIIFATSPGQVAFDGDGSGRNGLFTEALLQYIRLPGLKIEDVFKKVRRAVREKSQKSGREQLPWINYSIEEDFYFRR